MAWRTWELIHTSTRSTTSKQLSVQHTAAEDQQPGQLALTEQQLRVARLVGLVVIATAALLRLGNRCAWSSSGVAFVEHGGPHTRTARVRVAGAGCVSVSTDRGTCGWMWAMLLGLAACWAATLAAPAESPGGGGAGAWSGP